VYFGVAWLLEDHKVGHFLPAFKDVLSGDGVSQIATANRCTMANDSLLKLQEQWQWHQLNQLVIISLL
jgi:hypothetical protein